MHNTTKTLGELRAVTAHLPDDTALVMDDAADYTVPEFWVDDGTIYLEPFPMGDTPCATK